LAKLRAREEVSPRAFVECGQAFMSFSMLGEAVGAYSDAIARDRECVDGFLGRAEAGYALMLLSTEDETVEEIGLKVAGDFRRGLEIGGKSRETVLGLGSTLLAMNRFAECANWIEEQLRGIAGDKEYEGDLLYLLALCRLFAGDADDASEHANKMNRIAGFDAERLFICGLVSWLKGNREDFIERYAALQLQDEKLADVFRAIEAGARVQTFLDLARLML
jgi:tetratricopeptide (TPR) repeat protein